MARQRIPITKSMAKTIHGKKLPQDTDTNISKSHVAVPAPQKITEEIKH